jgi:hypothetical protein
MCTLDMSDAHSRDSLLHFSQHAVVGGSLVYSVQVSSNFIWSGSNFHCSYWTSRSRVLQNNFQLVGTHDVWTQFARAQLARAQLVPSSCSARAQPVLSSPVSWPLSLVSWSPVPNPFPSRATERKETDDRARVLGPMSAKAPENTWALFSPCPAHPCPAPSLLELKIEIII